MDGSWGFAFAERCCNRALLNFGVSFVRINIKWYKNTWNIKMQMHVCVRQNYVRKNEIEAMYEAERKR